MRYEWENCGNIFVSNRRVGFYFVYGLVSLPPSLSIVLVQSTASMLLSPLSLSTTFIFITNHMENEKYLQIFIERRKGVVIISIPITIN